LLKEVAEMSKLNNLAKKEDEMSTNELEAKSNYNNLVMKNYQPPLDIEERMKKLKFAKKENVPSQANWFSQFKEMKIAAEEPKPEKKELSFGLSKADQIQIHKEMIP
jgi:hypothetical protein